MSGTYEYLKTYGDKLEKKIKQLLNSDLKAILKDEGLAVSGNKAVLQERILEREWAVEEGSRFTAAILTHVSDVRNAIDSEDQPRFVEIYNGINKYGSGGSGHILDLPTGPTPAFSHTATASSMPSHNQVTSNGSRSSGSQYGFAMGQNCEHAQRPHFHKALYN